MGTRPKRTLRRLRRDEDGIAAIEFGILAVPFLMLLFGILELAIVFFASAALDHGTAQAGRLIRTDQIDHGLSESQRKEAFREEICENMAVFKDCKTRLIVDLVAHDSDFNAVNLPAPAPYDPDFDREAYEAAASGGPAYSGSPPPTETFQAAGRDAVVLLRTQYVHQLAIPGWLTRLSNDRGNTRRLTSITAFKNEPF